MNEWLELILRWFHVIAGIAWIGSSFYFIALDLSLKQNKNLPPQSHGEAWQVHGGGFYHLVKYLVAPSKLPSEGVGKHTTKQFIKDCARKGTKFIISCCAIIIFKERI